MRADWLIGADGARSACPDRARDPHARLGRGVRRRHGDVPRPAVGGRRPAPPRHLLDHPPRDARHLPPGRRPRPLAGRLRRRRRPLARADRGAHPDRRGRPRPARRGRPDRQLLRRRADGGALPRRPRLPRRRRRPPRDPARRDRAQRRVPGRLRPRLEARVGDQRLGRRAAARHLRGGAPPGGGAQREALRRPGGHDPRARAGAAGRHRRAHPARVGGRARLHARPPRPGSHALHRRRRRAAGAPPRRSCARRLPLTVRRVAPTTARALGIGAQGGALLAKPDGTPASVLAPGATAPALRAAVAAVAGA